MTTDNNSGEAVMKASFADAVPHFVDLADSSRRMLDMGCLSGHF